MFSKDRKSWLTLHDKRTVPKYSIHWVYERFLDRGDNFSDLICMYFWGMLERKFAFVFIWTVKQSVSYIYHLSSKPQKVLYDNLKIQNKSNVKGYRPTQTGGLPLHSSGSWQVLLLLPFSIMYPHYHIMLPHSSIIPFSGDSDSGHILNC